MPRKLRAVPGHRPPGTIWVLFDHVNGLDGGKNYTFWFETRQKAIGYKRWLAKYDADGDRQHGRKPSKSPHVTGPFKYHRALSGTGKPL